MFWLANLVISTTHQDWRTAHETNDKAEKPQNHGNLALASSTSRSLWVRILNSVITMQQRFVTARVLNGLSDHLLKDIGITRFEINNYVRSIDANKTADRKPHLTEESAGKDIHHHIDHIGTHHGNRLNTCKEVE